MNEYLNIKRNNLIRYIYILQDGLRNISDGIIDGAFRKVRKNSIGFHIWKVEVNFHYFLSNFLCKSYENHLKLTTIYLTTIRFNRVYFIQNNRVEALPKEKFGVFYDDCTYIIYASTIKGNIVNQYTIVREISIYSFFFLVN